MINPLSSRIAATPAAGLHQKKEAGPGDCFSASDEKPVQTGFSPGQIPTAQGAGETLNESQPLSRPQQGSQGSAPATMNVSEAAQQLLTGTAEDTSHLLWHADIGGRILTPPGVDARGGLYAINDDGLTALGPDGEKKWTVPTQGFNIFSTPAVDQKGTVYVGGLGQGAPGLFAFSSKGKLLWKKKIGEVRTPPVVDRNGNVYAATIEGKLFAFSPKGKKLWDYDAGEKINFYPTIGSDGTIYIATECGPLQAVTSEGKLKWKRYGENSEYFESFTGIGITPDGELLGAMWNSHLRAMDSEGNTKWLFGAFTGKRADELPPDVRKEALKAGNMGVSTTPVTSPDGSTIYIGGTCGKFMAVDRDGHLKWSMEPGEGIHGNNVRVAENGTVYVISGREGTIYALDPSGEVKWKYQAKEKNSCFITLHGDTVYLCTRGGDIYALNEEALSKRLKERQAAGGKEAAEILDLGEGWITIGGIKLEKRNPS